MKFPADTYLVGIDISQGQLDRNQGLQERILGDIQTYELPRERFDAVVCWDVLEHLQRPEDALERFADTVGRGGIIILSAPNPLSTKGIVTKLTPYSFHVWFYRRVRGWKEAGTKGNPPFPTYLKMTMSPGAIRRFAERRGLRMLYGAVEGDGDSRDVLGRKNAGVDLVMKLLNGILKLVSFGKIEPKATQFYFVMSKSPSAASAGTKG